jgi:hypothetical protein
MNNVNVRTLTSPPSRGPLSGKWSWISYAQELEQNSEILLGIVDNQTATIRDLQAEIELLKKQIETRNAPPGRYRNVRNGFHRLNQKPPRGT